MSTLSTAEAVESLTAERDRLLTHVERLKARFVDAAARRCLERGWMRVALWGEGTAVRTLCRQPWRSLGIEVAGVIVPSGGEIEGLAAPVSPPSRAAELHAHAVVICTDKDEALDAARAGAVPALRGVPVVRIYGDLPDYPAWGAEELIGRCGVSERDAEWLVEHRSERHDASLPMLAPSRTELHLRRYELALPHVRDRRVLDAACGTGYGSEMLACFGGARSVVGLDVDARAVDYASRRHAAAGVEFHAADASRTGLTDGSIDVVVSFETVEHVPDAEGLIDEFARVLTPDGLLVMSTPNDWGPTEHHCHSFDRGAFVGLIERRFEVVELYGQRACNEPQMRGLPGGIYPLRSGAPEPELFVTLARAVA